RQLWTFNTRTVVEKAVGSGCRSAIVFAEVSVKLVGTALGHQLNLAAAASSIRSTGVGRHATEFLNPIHGSITDSRSYLAGGLIVRVDSVDGDVSVVSAGTGNRTDSVCPGCTNVISDHTGLQTNQRRGGTSNLNGKLFQPPLANDVSDTRV